VLETDAYAQDTHQFLTCMLTAQHVLKGASEIWNLYAYAEKKRKKLMRICSGYAPIS
jgi:hypothetical protein